jgi:conjugative transfer signal peptidase TraF
LAGRVAISRAANVPGDVELLIKTVAAIPGDEVDVTAGGIAVNGHPIPRSAPLPRDDAGRKIQAMERGTYRVGPATVWIIAGSDIRSFDSRYFGPVPIANLRGQARPLFVQ